MFQSRISPRLNQNHRHEATRRQARQLIAVQSWVRMSVEVTDIRDEEILVSRWFVHIFPSCKTSSHARSCNYGAKPIWETAKRNVRRRLHEVGESGPSETRIDPLWMWPEGNFNLTRNSISSWKHFTARNIPIVNIISLGSGIL